MSKFCTSCGASLDDNATFCTNCGTAQGNAQPQGGAQAAAGAAVNTVKNTFNDIKDKVDVNAIKDSLSAENIKNLKTNPNKNTLIALGGILVVVIIVIAILASILGGGYKKPVDNLFKAMADGDGKALQKSMPSVLLKSDDYEENILEYSDYDDIDEYFDDMAKKIQDSLEDEFGKKLKISYKVTDKDELSDKKLKDIKSTLKDQGAKNVKVTKGYELDLEVKIKGKEDDDEDDMTLTVVKVNGDWCIAGTSIYNLFS